MTTEIKLTFTMTISTDTTLSALECIANDMKDCALAFDDVPKCDPGRVVYEPSNTSEQG